jgi:hypothetical protein
MKNDFVKEVFVYTMGFLLLVFYLYSFEGFFSVHGIWILCVFGYIIYFMWRDYIAKLEEVEENVRVKDTKEMRINFWH